MKFLKKNKFKFLGTALLGLFLTFSFPVQADPPPWAPAHGYRAKHHKHSKKTYSYVYYPAAQVYYSPVVRKYYYMNNGAWVTSPTAPLSINLGKSVSIQLGGSVPYVYHPTVIQEYPVVVVPK